MARAVPCRNQIVSNILIFIACIRLFVKDYHNSGRIPAGLLQKKSVVALFLVLKALTEAGGKCRETSPYWVIRNEAIPLRRSSVTSRVTEDGAAHIPCHSGMGEIPRRWLMITHPTPKWQNKTMVSLFAAWTR